jgi:ribosomal protein S18 acetylase RimI-like enzyme
MDRRCYLRVVQASGVPPIRPALVDEVESVRLLVERAYQHYVPRIGMRPGPMDADYRSLVEAGEVFVLTGQDDPGQDESGPAIAGLIVLRSMPDGYLLIENVAVDPRRRGEGLGRELMAFADAEARARGLPELRLYTHEAMTENIAWYRRLGWEEYERRAEVGFARVFFRRRVA